MSFKVACGVEDYEDIVALDFDWNVADYALGTPDG
jgi:hypothetical protein